MLRYVINSDFI